MIIEVASTKTAKRFMAERVELFYGNSGNKTGKKIMVVINKIMVNSAPTRA